MSSHIIKIEKGIKMMIPVRTREEYMALRDSEENRQADKKHMVQMNYSCLPNDDGTLKGTKRMSSTIGADIDVPIDTEFVLSKKEELGLLMFENSATKAGCGHVVCRRTPGLTQEENLKRISEILGVEYDKGAKDITRVFYTPADKLVYLDDELFNIEPFEAPTPALPIIKEEKAESKAAEPAEAACMQSLIAFDLCAETAKLNTAELDKWGEHNWHSNLIAIMSVGLPKLMSKAQLIAVIKEKMPNYSKTKDCEKVINSFYDNYSADTGYMSSGLRDINAKSQEMARASVKSENSDDDKELEELTKDWTPPTSPKKIPRLLELLVSNYDPRFRDMLLLSALPVLSAHASHFRATYLNGQVIGPPQFVCVIGGSGQGKGNCTALFNEMVKHTLQSNDNAEWKKVRENAEFRDKMANAKERPSKYHPKLRLFETVSKSSILDLQTNLGKNGMLLGHFSEVDALAGSSRSAFSDITVLLRKGWDIDMMRQYYMSDATCNSAVQMCLSLLLTGTPKAVLERMFTDANCEGGLMQRFIPVLVPKTKRTFRPPRQNYLSEEEKNERDTMLIDLYQKDLALNEETQWLDTPMMNHAIGQWFDQLEVLYNDGKLTEAEADLSHRCGEFMLRAAIPLIALNGGESKEIVDFCRWVGEIAHYNMCRIFGHRVQNDITSANELLEARMDKRKTVEPLLDKLPAIFTLQQFKELRVKEGLSPNVKMVLSRYCKNGKLERIRKGLYRKIDKQNPLEGNIGNIVTVTEDTDPTGEDELEMVDMIET